MLREALENSPRRKDEARFAVTFAFEDFACADPAGARTFAFDHVGLPIAGRAARDEEHGVEPANGVELWNPAREWRQASDLDSAACLDQELGKIFISDELPLEIERRLSVRKRRETHRHCRLFDGFANCRDRR